MELVGRHGKGWVDKLYFYLYLVLFNLLKHLTMITEKLTKNKILLSEREIFVASRIVNAAFVVHNELGPGLLEKVYEICMAHVLMKEGIKVIRQKTLPIQFQGLTFEEGLRLDLDVDDLVICEIKAVDIINPVWQAQVLSHLALSGRKVGFLINFNVPLIKDGIRRFVK